MQHYISCAGKIISRHKRRPTARSGGSGVLLQMRQFQAQHRELAALRVRLPQPTLVKCRKRTIKKGFIVSSLRSTFRAIILPCDVRTWGKQNTKNSHLTFSDQEALQSRPLCKDKLCDQEPLPPQSSHSVGISSNMNMPLHKLKIKVPLPLTICLLL
jgi:hypothetical protein